MCAVEDNLLTTTRNVTSLAACGALCAGGCTDFTLFGPNDFPFHDTCMTFSSCTAVRACTDCTSVTTDPDCTCSINYHGAADNYVDIQWQVADEKGCKQACVAHGECEVYTYYSAGHSEFPRMCLLLDSSGLQQQVEQSSQVISGPATCQVGGPCKVAVWESSDWASEADGAIIYHYGDNRLSFISGERECTKAVAAVLVGGGGGKAQGFGGGGSGMVEVVSIDMVAGDQFTFAVGDQRVDTVVRDKVGAVVATARAGESPVQDQTLGCQGYSGGGGGTGGAGGTDGGDGDDGANGAGGQGSGVKVEEVALRYFVLTPGAGGGPTGFFGGGGGGVVVDGVENPDRTEYQVPGGGGGGGGVVRRWCGGGDGGGVV